MRSSGTFLLSPPRGPQSRGIPAGTTATAILLGDIFQAVTGQAHPLRPLPSSTGATKHESTAARLRAQRALVAAQRRKEAS
ncbi:hypothetical protein Q0Z83_054300 [Actinoplanes sichuanensis]|nr:hypothetical protein Q0Z83_054300 [Actinoplanes sichuanensis]